MTLRSGLFDPVGFADLSAGAAEGSMTADRGRANEATRLGREAKGPPQNKSIDCHSEPVGWIV